jgi:phosphatidylinositol alpha-1,6-mannosyltransferase
LKDTPGDVEGFGMVAIEAALFGLPTVAFAVGGVVDAIEDGRSGYLIYPGQYQEFAQIIIRYLTTPGSAVTSGACMSHAKKYSWDSFGERLRGVCKSIAK